MSKKTMITFATLTLCAGIGFAQTAPTSAPNNTHQRHDKKARECRKQGAEKQLIGEELRAFVATCITPPKA